MNKLPVSVVLAGCVLASTVAVQASAQNVSPSKLIEDALNDSSLTHATQPFHALLQIGSGTGEYTGSVELWWQSATNYRVAIKSPSFTQVRVVSGEQVQEDDAGDYYPRWLQNFVDALLDPVPRPHQFEAGSLSAGMQGERICLARDDRPGGITDNLTWGHLCFRGQRQGFAVAAHLEQQHGVQRLEGVSRAKDRANLQNGR